MTKTGDRIVSFLLPNLYLMFCLGFALTFSPPVQAADKSVQVQAVLGRSDVGLGDTVVVSVIVSSAGSFEASEPRVPRLDGLNLVNSWNSSSTSSKLMQTPSGMQFETMRRQEFNYMLSPSRPGRLQVPPFTVVVDGKSYTTKPLTVNVSKEGSGAARQQQVPGMPDLDDIDEADQAFQQLLHRQNVAPPAANKLLPHNTNESFFVQAEVDKTSVYEGEQITVSWYIYTRGNMLSLDRVKFPDLHGFWKEVIEEVPALSFQQEIVNGVPYRKALLASHALFPIKPGVAVIDEYKIKASVQVPQGPFGFGPAYTYTRSSDRIKIDVKPLPLEGRPKDFTGAVGQFDMRSTIDGQSFPANQPFSLKVRFDGSGNAKTIELPPLQIPSGLEIYDTKNESKFFKNGRSYKEFEVLVIPRQEGEVTIPSLSASFFDPATAKYYTRTTPAISLHITPAAAGNVGSSRVNGAATIGGRDAQQKNQLPDVLLSSDARESTFKNWQVYAQLALWIVVMLVLGFKARREWGRKKAQNVKLEFARRLKKIQQISDKGDWRSAGTEVANLIYFVLGEISGQGGAHQELGKLLDLAPPSVRRELGDILQKQVDIFQVIGFAPEAVVGKYKEKAELKNEIQAVVKTLEKALQLASRD